MKLVHKKAKKVQITPLMMQATKIYCAKSAAHIKSGNCPDKIKKLKFLFIFHSFLELFEK